VGNQLALADSNQDQQSQPLNNPEKFAPPPKSKTRSVNTNRPSYSFSKASSLREALAVIHSRSSSRSASPKKKSVDLRPVTSTSSTPKTTAQEIGSESHKKAHIEALSRQTAFWSKTSLTPWSVELFNNAPTSPLHALNFTSPTQATTSSSNIHSSGEFTPNTAPMVHNLPTKTRTSEPSEPQSRRSTRPSMPPIMEMESEPKLSQRLGMEEGFEKSPMAQLILEYSSATIESELGPTETSITLVLSLEELTVDLIVDRGENRDRCLPRYYLVTATMKNICMAVAAQQIFLQRASALISERNSHFIVDPGDTLIPILQGTSSLPQLYAAWKALLTRIKLGVKAWDKYIAEYQLQADTALLSPLSTLQELYDPLIDIPDVDNKL